jgi:hypothetical protein
MRRVLSTAVVTMFVGALLPPLAEDRPAPIAPPKTMGDKGKLPPTAKGAAPEMGATVPAQIGAQKRIGDQARHVSCDKGHEWSHTADESARRSTSR